jgi:hypothetical protein
MIETVYISCRTTKSAIFGTNWLCWSDPFRYSYDDDGVMNTIWLLLSALEEVREGLGAE